MAVYLSINNTLLHCLDKHPLREPMMVQEYPDCRPKATRAAVLYRL